MAWPSTNWLDADYGFGRAITIPDALLTGASLTDVVAIIRVSGDFSEARADGNDIKWAEGAGDTEIPYATISFDNGASGHWVGYVAFDTPASGAETLYFYYGKPGETVSQADPTNLHANMQRHWDLDANGDDLTGNDDLTNSGVAFNGTNAKITDHDSGDFELGDGDSLDGGTGSPWSIDEFTLLFWVRHESVTLGTPQAYVAKTDTVPASVQDVVLYSAKTADAGQTEWDFIIKTGGSDATGSTELWDENVGPDNATWHLKCCRYDGSNMYLDADGAPGAAIDVSTAKTGNIRQNAWAWYVGDVVTFAPYDGRMFGVRLLDSYQTDDWVDTVYNIENDNGASLTIGSEQTAPVAGGAPTATLRGPLFGPLGGPI